MGVLVSLTSAAADVTVQASVDSMMMWVGQQAGLHLEVTCDPDQRIEFPLFGDTLVTDLEIVPPVLTDTIYLNDGKRMSVTRHYTVTCFDSALIYIAPIPVKVDGVEYVSNRLALAFMTYDIPQGQETEIFGPKENLGAPVQFWEIRLPLLLYILSMFAIVSAVFLFKRYKDDKPIIRHIKVEARIPAHKRALDGIEELRRSGLASGDNPKQYYTRLTDLLREYINERFGFNATEMTSDEILEHLRKHRDKDSLQELANLLSTSDLVKFAKWSTLVNENDANLVNAIDFINQTKQENVPTEEVVKPELTEEQQQSRKMRKVLIAVIAVLSLLTVALLAYIGWFIYDLLLY